MRLRQVSSGSAWAVVVQYSSRYRYRPAYLHVHKCMYTHMCVLCMYAIVYVCVCKCMYACICMNDCMYVFRYVGSYVPT